jgi:hypothetical protein
MKKLEMKLKDALISLAENLLPARSGHDKILEVVVKMISKQGQQMFAKIIFWHPGNYMMVAASFETTLENIEDDDFGIEANHDTTWRTDGFNFFRSVMREPEEITIPSFKIIEVEDAFVDDTTRTFVFKRK